MRSGRDLLQCVLAAVLAGASSAPALAESSTHPTTRPVELEAIDESPQAAATRRVEALFRQNERQIRHAINNRQFDRARERVELARRMLESARGELPSEHYRDLARQLDSLARFIASEERMSAARPPEGVSGAGAKLEPGEPAHPRAGGHRAEDGPPRREALARQEVPDRSTGDRRVPQRLRETPLTIDFPQGTGFEEFVNWLRQRSGLSIHVNWRALADVGVDRTTDTLGLTLAGARLETVLRLVLENISPPEAPLGYDITDGIVRISTRELLDQYRFTRVYDVSDLLVRPPSFRSDSDLLGVSGGMGMGGMGTMGGMGPGAGFTGFPAYGGQGQQSGLAR